MICAENKLGKIDQEATKIPKYGTDYRNLNRSPHSVNKWTNQAV
jgi:hypothetical protein